MLLELTLSCHQNDMVMCLAQFPRETTMSYQPEGNTPGARAPMMTLSEDGYVRLTLETFSATALVHLLSRLDSEAPPVSPDRASLAPMSGFTEWVSTTTPAVTLGWDWWLDPSQQQARYVRLGAPRSNVMIIDAAQRDLGRTRTLKHLEAAIDLLAWPSEVQRHIAGRCH